ncbi:MAG: acetate--CoA ligase family protein [Rhizobiaceae bacterium]|nr:acetate--CoA ligase family protein [Rhizobiaceae bacterium]
MPEIDHRLRPLLDPRSIAIVGASQNPARVGGMPFFLCLQHGFKGQLYPVNPKYDAIEGITCYPDISSVPEPADIVALAVPAAEVSAELRRAAAAGMRSAVVFASGFAEAGDAEGKRLQDELEATAAEIGIPVAGPNCMGFANLKSHAYTVFGSVFKNLEPPRSGQSVALLTQSGNVCATVYQMGRKLGVPFATVVNTGNEAAVEFSEYLDYFAADPDIDTVVGYVEGLRNGDRFRAVADRLRERGVPLILLKIGDTDKGAAAAASHTAALAGSQAVYRAVFDEHNVIQASDLSHLADLTYLARFRAHKAGPRVAVLTISGALGALLSDKFVQSGCEVPTLPADLQAVLRTGIPSYGMVANPVDLTGNIVNEHAFFSRVLAALQESDAVDMIVLYAPGYLLDKIAPAIVEAAPRSSKLLAVIDTQEAKSRASLEAAGSPIFEDTARAVAALSTFARWSQRSREATPARPAAVKASSLAAGIVAEARKRGATALDEVAGKALIAQYGAAGTPERKAASEAEAVAAASALGFPVVVKVLSADILHKSDIGGVKLNLADTAAVAAAWRDVTAAARKAMPGARIDGVVVQKQEKPGVEVLAGITRDPVFGPVLTVGLGGIFTEILKDIQNKPLPATASDVEAMLRSLKGYPLLAGVRGKPACDIAGLSRTIAALGDAYLAHPEIAELEVNPIVVRPGEAGAVALDCLVTLSPADGQESGKGVHA